MNTEIRTVMIRKINFATNGGIELEITSETMPYDDYLRDIIAAIGLDEEGTEKLFSLLVERYGEEQVMEWIEERGVVFVEPFEWDTTVQMW